MLRQLSHYFESKTGVYLYPRFIASILALLGALAFFGIVYIAVRTYTASIETVGPNGGEAQEKYDARMRAGMPASALEQ